MGFNDFGLQQLGSFLIGLSPSNPDYVAVGTVNSANDYTVNYLGSECFRTGITWTWKNGDPYGTFAITTNDCNGSTIGEVGLGIASTPLGSDLYARELSAIGDKNSSFSISSSFTIRLRRA